MKKTLSMLAILGIVAVIGSQSANAFEWSSMNPAYWGHCPKCEKKKADCKCKQKVKKCDPCEKVKTPCPCETGAAAPCDPCAKKPAPCDPCAKKSPCNIPAKQPCDACDKLQEISK